MHVCHPFPDSAVNMILTELKPFPILTERLQTSLAHTQVPYARPRASLPSLPTERQRCSGVTERHVMAQAHMFAVDVLRGVAVEAVLDETLRVQPVQNGVRVRRQLIRVHHQLIVLRHLLCAQPATSARHISRTQHSNTVFPNKENLPSMRQIWLAGEGIT